MKKESLHLLHASWVLATAVRNLQTAIQSHEEGDSKQTSDWLKFTITCVDDFRETIHDSGLMSH